MSDSPSGERRVLGALSAMSIVAGSMLGIGIFLTPAIVATHIQSTPLFFGLWLLAGVTAMAGAVAYAELGTMMPEAGGDVVFLRAAYGPSLAFASGWIIFAAVSTGSIAAMGMALCQYQLPALLNPLLEASLGAEARLDPAASWLGPLTGAQLLAVLLILLVTAVNGLGAKLSAGLQNLTTVLPVAVFTVGAVVALFIGDPPPSPIPVEPVPLTAAGVVAAYMAVYFAYSGWNAVIYVAGEVERPTRNIPLGLLGGTGVIVVLYLLMCAGFMAALGPEGLRGAGEAGTATAVALGGPRVGWVMTALIAFGLLGSINGTVLGGARVAYAMARSGDLWRGFGQLSERSGVPARALWLQALIACLFALTGTFELLLNFVSLAMLLLGGLTVGAVYVLRRTQPQRARPYKATAYPWFPAVYLLASVLVIGVVISEAVTEPTWKTLFPLLGFGGLLALTASHALVRRFVRGDEVSA